MKRPLVPVVISYAAGLLLADHLHPPVLLLFAAAMSLLLVAFLLLRRTATNSLAFAGVSVVLTLVCLGGWINLAWRADLVSPLDLRQKYSGEPQFATLRGKLFWSPEERIRNYENRPSTRTLAWIETHSVRLPGGEWMPVEGRVLVTTPGALPQTFGKGAEVEITGVLAHPPGPEADGLFDYRKYLSRQYIHFQLGASGSNDWVIRREMPAGCSQRFVTWASSVLTRGIAEPGKPLLLLLSMTLGARSTLDPEYYDPFIKTGTMHIFAVSGLHVALISAMLLFLLRFFGLPRSWCGMIALPLIWFYTGATGWQPSAIRAALMISVVIGGWVLVRPTDLINSLCAAALVILVWDPQQLFGASFQLSFFVVLSIALLLPRIEAIRDRFLRHDPMLPPDLVPKWQRWSYTPVRWLTNALGISLAAWLGAMPLTIYYFHLFTPVTLLANVVIVPLSNIALGCNMGSLVCGHWIPPITELLNQVAVMTMQRIVTLSEIWSSQAWGALHVRALSPLELAAYYTLLLGVFSGWLLQKPRRWYVLGSAPVACIAIFSSLHYNSVKTTSLTVLPVDGGMAIYGMAAGEHILIDCGRTNPVERLVVPYLRARGVNTIHRFAMTHGDAQHIGGAQLVEAVFKIQTACASPLKFRSPVYRRCIDHFRAKSLLHEVFLGHDIGPWHILHPMDTDKAPQADAAALVLATNLRGTRVLLLPDLNRAGQETLLNRAADLQAEIVIAGLPDDGEPLCDALIAKIQPALIIIGDSIRPSYSRVKSSVTNRLRASGAKLLCTSQAGVTTIEFTDHGYRINSAQVAEPFEASN